MHHTPPAPLSGQRLLIFGLGYTAARFADAMRGAGWAVDATGSKGNLDFADMEAVNEAIGRASHVLSSVPPERDGGTDPVLDAYGRQLVSAPASWIGYLSSTGVYGDTKGAWVDESAPVGTGRRSARAAADLAWQELAETVRVFRLPGIYGPGRSALDRVREGRAHRIALENQIFSRIHVDDIVGGLIASLSRPAGVYNLSDDYPCSQNEVIEAACDLTGVPYPPMMTIEEAGLSPMARAFYAENRRVANGRAKRVLGWRVKYPTYQEGLGAV
jgi:nucleoside-diphosphate-sugar epimerase